jgi:hypothetical protein
MAEEKKFWAGKTQTCMKTNEVALGILGVMAALAIKVHAQTGGVTSFANDDLLASYSSDGLVDLNAIGTWNGAPITDSNQPSTYDRQLADTINFFTPPAQPNILFVQITDVITTHFDFAFGATFNNITQTGVQFSLPLRGGGSLGIPGLSLNYANAGQTLAYSPLDNSSAPLTSTPGFGLSLPGQNKFLLQTVSGFNYGFINQGWVVNGGSADRIEGGGVFELAFPSNIDLINQIDFGSAVVESQYGAGNQYVTAQLVSGGSVPDAGNTACFLAPCIVGLVGLRRKSA